MQVRIIIDTMQDTRKLFTTENTEGTEKINL
jgi:hypothetical protein